MFHNSATNLVQQNTQIYPPCFKGKPCFLTNIQLNYLHLFHVPLILVLTDIYYIYIYIYFYIHIYIIYIYIYIYIGVSAYPQKHRPSLFFAKPLINQKIVKAPSPLPILFSQFVPLCFDFLQSS